MGSVTGLTADRMLAIEGSSVVDGDIVGNNLILTKHDGSTVDAGNVRGPAGPTGPPGSLPTLVNALPTTPTEGQEVYYQTPAMETLGVFWHLRYRALNRDGSPNTSFYKWEAANPHPITKFVNSFTASSTSPVNVTGLTLSNPLKGEYRLSVMARMTSGYAGFNQCVLSPTGFTSDGAVGTAGQSGLLGASPSKIVPITFSTAPQTLQAVVTVSGGAVDLFELAMHLTPVRVGL